ncbi:hypothetical protein QBC39DRAFT_410324 [Podospora conica]|nr:hypothetical protein QBC39DRAFT_410324 [Schizothecium conicum]
MAAVKATHPWYPFAHLPFHGLPGGGVHLVPPPCTCYTLYQFYACGCPDTPSGAPTLVPCPVSHRPFFEQVVYGAYGFAHATKIPHDPAFRVLPFACYEHTQRHTRWMWPEVVAAEMGKLKGKGGGKGEGLIEVGTYI